MKYLLDTIESLDMILPQAQRLRQAKHGQKSVIMI